MSTRKITSPAMEIIEGEMFIFGEKLPRHPEFPWLFSATALHKFCEEAIKLRAEQNGKDPEKFYKAKRPAQWVRFNILGDNNQERIEQYAKHTRTRIKKYGPNLGFGLNVSRLTFNLDTISDLDLVIQTRAGRYGGGSYLCQLAIVNYIQTFSEKFRATVQNSFISMVNGEVETVTEEVVEAEKKAKGTQTRRENKQLNDEAVAECGKKGILPMKFQEGINVGVLGMPASKYKEKHDISEPFNDNLPITLVDTKNLALLLGAQELRTDPRKHISNAEGRAIGKTNGIRARIIFTDKRALKYLDKLAAGKKNNKKPKT